MKQPFMTKVCAPIAGIVPRKVDVQMWIEGLSKALKETNRERPQSEVTRRDWAARQRKLKIMIAEFDEYRKLMD